MNERNRDANDALTGLLRLGDPAAESGGPDAAEIDRVRRRILAEASHAAETAPRRPWLAPSAFATAALATALLAALLARRPAEGPPQPGPPRAGPEPASEIGTAPAPSIARERPPRSPEPATVLPPPSPPSFTSAAGASSTRAVAREKAAPVARPRDPTAVATTIRFTTHRGTQIIWTLDPRVEL